MIKYFIIFLFIGIIYSQNEKNDYSPTFDFLSNEDFKNFDLKLILSEGENEIFEKYFHLSVISELIQIKAPKYDKKNNSGFLLPISNYSSIYINYNLSKWIDASTYMTKNSDIYSSGFFNSSPEKFSYYNSRKGFMDIDNYFKDPWDQRATDDYIRYLHTPPTLSHTEINTIYDRDR
ncbi:MAG: hypothetical protein ACJ0RN_03640 [Candidatus Neomarinimicrobiota bacterium]|tara:strand:+ start:178 stop:708 length:531 start_codon:yes stop_codon:yes gene_type:complete